jgi:hypothetical protein
MSEEEKESRYGRQLRYYKNYEPEVYVLCGDKSLKKYTNAFDLLKERVKILCMENSDALPEDWLTLCKFLKSLPERTGLKKNMKLGVWQLEDVQEVCQKENPDLAKYLEICLQYMHDKGGIIWFHQEEELGKTVFLNTDVLINLLKDLLNHRLAKELKYSEVFKDDHYDKTIFAADIHQFLQRGTITQSLLKCIWLNYGAEGTFHASIIRMLELRNICFRVGEELDSPLYFPILNAKRKPDNLSLWSGKLPEDRAEVRVIFSFFKQLPECLYEQMSVRLLQSDSSIRQSRVDWKDGLCIGSSTETIMVERSPAGQDDPYLRMKIRVPKDRMEALWLRAFKIYEDVKELLRERPNVPYRPYFECPHCIMKEDPEPTKRLFQVPDEDQVLEKEDLVACKQDVYVPYIMAYPYSKCHLTKY